MFSATYKARTQPLPRSMYRAFSEPTQPESTFCERLLGDARRLKDEFCGTNPVPPRRDPDDKFFLSLGISIYQVASVCTMVVKMATMSNPVLLSTAIGLGSFVIMYGASSHYFRSRTTIDASAASMVGIAAAFVVVGAVRGAPVAAVFVLQEAMMVAMLQEAKKQFTV